MTILFGENASGKTGYVRILKRAAAVRTVESVLPNVMGSPQKIPRAHISYRLSNKEESIEWANDAGMHPFTRMDVFDARGSQLHLDEDLTYTYTPGELSLFPLVQQSLEKVKAKLDADIKHRTVTTNPYVREFERGSSVYPKIESLGAATNVQELRNLAIVSEDDKASVASLREEIDALRSQSPEAQSKLLRAEQQLLDSVVRAIRTIAEFEPSKYADARNSLALTREDYDRATRSAFAGMDIPGILQPEWQRFIRAGEELLAATGQSDYPNKDDRCLFCHQSLDNAALELLKKYRDYCNNQLGTAVSDAQAALSEIAAPISNLDLPGLRERIRGRLSESTDDQTILVGAVEVLTSAEQLQARVKTTDTITETSLRDVAASTAKKIEVRQQELTHLDSDLKQRSAERQNALRDRESRFLNVTARIRLSERLPEIEQYIAEAQWVSKATIVGRRFQPIFKSLTEASKTASERLLNQNFEKRFKRECKKLRAPEVKLFFPGRQGQVARRKSVVADHRLSEILSEGEQKVIALADFLAEVELRPKAPIIFDDPVNSLDYRRMTELVDRLVELSHDRQVVVFTHNIWFTMELLSRYEKTTGDCSYYDVQADGARFGVVSKGNHPRADTYKNLKGKLNTLIQSAVKVSGETQAALIEKGYEHLRSICEVVVESELLQGVTQRYQPNVKMTMLPNIKFEKLKEASETVFKVFEKCCRCIASHSQPMETLNVRPTLSDLKEDWEKVEDAVTKYRS